MKKIVILLEDLLSAVELDGQKYLCITRPRRFGKSVMANMVAAFLGRAAGSERIFRKLRIESSEKYQIHRNQYSVIYIDFSGIPEKRVKNTKKRRKICDLLINLPKETVRYF